MHEIRRIDPATFYASDTVAHKIKGVWIWFIDGQPFAQAQTLEEMMAVFCMASPGVSEMASVN